MLNVNIKIIKLYSFKSKLLLINLNRRVIINFNKKESMIIYLKILSIIPEAS